MRLFVIAMAGLGLALGLARVGLAPAPAAPPGAGADDAEPAGSEARAVEPGPAAGGRALRLETEHGPVYVWTPPGYRADTAGIAVYVHGYYTDLDDAWRDHDLPEQFAASGRNALFIVPEAPAGGHHKVYWNQLGDLVREVRRHGELVMPWGPIVALGHSGAYRTLLEWLDDRQLAHVVLLDGLYGNEQPFLDWLDRGGPARRRLTLIGLDTLRWTALAASGHPEAYNLDWIPDDPADVPAAARAARLLHIQSQYSHMELITAGKALPVLLGMSGLPALADP